MLNMLMVAAALAGASVDAGGAGCADHWLVALGEDSFANNGAGASFSSSQLQAFEEDLAATLKRAIGQACVEGAIAPDLAAAVSGVTVVSASGASEPHFYAADDGQIMLEWVFAEEGLALPSDEELIAGTACWADPDDAACSAMGD